MLFQRSVGLGVLLLMLPGYVLSQETRPKFEIAAFVSDPSGAVLQGATVQVQGISVAMNLRGPTDVAGVFRIQLEAGEYTVSVTQSGFKPLTQQIEVRSVQDQGQRFSLVLMPSLVTCGPCFVEQTLFIEQTMSKLPDQLVLPPPVMLQLKPPVLHRNPIARFFSALRF